MNHKVIFLATLIFLLLAALTACGGSEEVIETVMVGELPMEEIVVKEVGATAAAPAEAPASSEAGQAAGEAAVVAVNADFQPSPNRLIIKNAELTLVVADTDVAIDRLTQAVSDAGGYILSTEMWFEEWQEESYKYATITLAVPVDRFEDTLRRLRGLAEKIQNEIASGQDVTDEYVDLDSQLKNLQATSDRIREFLDQAKTVEEALKVNEQLKLVEAEIEQVQGRMNYLFDRAAYSTITVHLEPVLPEAEPTPTPTPVPTPTSEPWKPGETAKSAGSTLVTLLQALVDLTIWLLVVIVPLLIPIALIVWLVLWLRKRRQRKPPASGSPEV